MDPIGEKLLEVAKQELGYQEKDGGYTKYGEWYGETLEGGDDYFTTAPWCDMFLAWAADKAGVAEWAGQFAATINHAEWFKEKDAWGREPEPGALVFFSWSGSKDIDAIEHVGIVESVDGSTLRTIEANTDGVYLKRKTRDVSDVVGYGYPGKVEVAGKQSPVSQGSAKGEQGSEAVQAAPTPMVDSITGGQPGSVVTTRQVQPGPGESPLVSTEATTGGLLALALCGTVVIAVGRSMAERLPSEPPVRIAKRGKHHRRPVSLPSDLTSYDLDEADAGTAVMPVLSAKVAAEAEEHEFWGRVSTFEADEDLAFWDTLHEELTPSHPVGERTDRRPDAVVGQR